jgi:DNA-binding transcriptional regulator YiaG
VTPSDLRSTIAALGLTTAGAARVLGVDERTVRRWLDGTRVMPEPCVRLLWACLRDRGLADWLVEKLGAG